VEATRFFYLFIEVPPFGGLLVGQMQAAFRSLAFAFNFVLYVL